MAVTATPVYIQNPKITPQSFVQGTDSAGTYKTVFTAGANGSKVTAVMVTTNDGSASHPLTLAVTRSAVTYPIITYTLPINSGGDGSTSGIDLLNGGPSSLLAGLPIDNDGQKYIFLESGDTLQVTFATALTAGKSIWAIAVGGNF